MHNIFFADSALHIIWARVASSWPWYIIRGAGFIAAGLLVLLILSGIGQVTGITYRFVDPIRSWAIHRALGIALCVSIAVHAGFLLIDRYVRFSLTQILIPFTSSYNNGTKLLMLPFGALAIAFGVLAMYGVLLIVASSLGWIDSHKHLWRTLHYLSYIVSIFIFLHALYAGSDLKYGAFRLAWIGLGALVLLAILIRLWRAGVVSKTLPAPKDNA